MATLKLNNLTKKWGSLVVVNDVSLDIQDKEFIVFLGPSGCGKTTIMRMIAGLEKQTSGEILIDDKCVDELEPKDRDIAMVFQNYGLYPNMSVYENICFPLKIRKIDPSTYEQKILKVAKMVELEDLLDRKPKALSGGQRQRVALARAIVREPKVFLMDEPLSNLDAKLRASTRLEIKKLQDELNVTTIYVTHDQIEAMTMAHRVVVINKGKIQQFGSPKQIYDNPANLFVATFIGSPPMNIIKGVFKQNSFTAKDIKIDDAHYNYNGEGHIGFRPEDVEVSKNAPADKSKCVICAKVYNFELLGDSCIISIKVQNQIINAKTDKQFEINIGDEIYYVIEKLLISVFDNNGNNVNAKY